MFFASDNAGPVLPEIMQRLNDANTGYAMPYGNDDIMDEVRAAIRTAFEAPEAAVYLVATGTAANSLALACYTQPWQTIFCTPVAHIHEDECNAPEFYAGGAKLTLVPGSDKMTPDALRRSIEGEEVRGVHGPQRGPVSITQVTERGGVYTLDELRALTAVAKELRPACSSGRRAVHKCDGFAGLYARRHDVEIRRRCSQLWRHQEWLHGRRGRRVFRPQKGLGI